MKTLIFLQSLPSVSSECGLKPRLFPKALTERPTHCSPVQRTQLQRGDPVHSHTADESCKDKVHLALPIFEFPRLFFIPLNVLCCQVKTIFTKIVTIFTVME